MRMVSGDVNIYYFHETLTPSNVRAASYGCDRDSGALVPEVGDIIWDFHGWDGEDYEPITVRVTAVKQIDGAAPVSAAFEVTVATIGE
jgi:hypothetical protein